MRGETEIVMGQEVRIAEGGNEAAHTGLCESIGQEKKEEAVLQSSGK